MKIGKIIAFELGFLIALLTWLAFARFPSAEQLAAAAASTPELPADSFATMVWLPKADHQSLQVAAEPQDQELEAAAQTEAPLEPVVVSGSQAAYDLANTSYGVASPDYYNGTSQEQGVYYGPDQLGYEPEPVLYGSDYFVSQSLPVVICPQPSQIIVVSNTRQVVRRHRPVARRQGPRVTQRRPGGLVQRVGMISRHGGMRPPQMRGGRPPQVRGGGTVGPRVVKARASRPVQRVAAR
ncbi:MAG: hypothetical protein ABI787_11620 [Spartobacteria bacterium]